jgi:hypothetical protein
MHRVMVWCGLALTSVSTAVAQNAATSLDRYLRDSVGLDAAQMADVQRGYVVAKALPADLSRDVAVFGIVAVHATRAAFESRLGDDRRAVAVRTQRFGIIGNPVRPGDVQPLSVDGSEYKNLRHCKPDDCNFKLPAWTMREFAEHVDWTGPQAKGQVDSLMRADVVRFVSAYRATGNAAMLEYDDAGGRKSSDAFAALLAQSPYLHEYAPALRDYLLEYPSRHPENARDVLYWSDDRIPHLRPTFTLNHMVIYTPPDGPPVVARKQIYADHYFEAAFELLAAFDAPSLPGGPGIYLVSVRRYRFDNLPSGGLLNIRGRVRDQLTQLVRSDLEHERAAAEGPPRG